MNGSDLSDFVAFELGCFLLVVLGLAAIVGGIAGCVTFWLMK